MFRCRSAFRRFGHSLARSSAHAIVHDISDRKRHEKIPAFPGRGESRCWRSTSTIARRSRESPTLRCRALPTGAWSRSPARRARSLKWRSPIAIRSRPNSHRRCGDSTRPMPDRPDISLRVLTTGKAELIPSVSDALLKNIAQNADHLRHAARAWPEVADRGAAAGTRTSSRDDPARANGAQAAGSTRKTSSWLRI